MTKYLYIIVAAAIATMLWSCHTNEKNYRDSYEKTVELNRTGDRGERYQQDLAERTHKNYVVDGDSIRLKYYNYTVTDDIREFAKKYGVVVAEFSQEFNAMSCRDRLRQQENLPAYVVCLDIKKEKTYCVIAKGFDDLSVAATFAKTPEKYMKMKVLVPMAWVLANATPQK